MRGQLPHALTATLAAVLVALLVGPAAAVSFNVLESDQSHTVVEVEFPPAELQSIELDGRPYELLSIDGTSVLGGVGDPALAVAATMIAVPPASGVELRVLDAEYTTVSCGELMPVQAENAEPGAGIARNDGAYSRDGLFPEAVASVGEPAIMRDYRIVPLRVYPASYDPKAGELRVARRVIIELDYSSPARTNVKTAVRAESPAFRELYRAQIANYDFVSPGRYESDSRGKYLIITADTYYDNIVGFADWKHRMGYEVEIAKLSVIGSSYSQIKSYIQTAYDTWTVPPEYILFVGDTDHIPTHGSSSGSDDGYCQLEGSDPLIDVFWGRFSGDSDADIDLIVDKTMHYERTPFMADIWWFRSACLIVRDDYDSSDATYYEDTWHAYDLMENEGFTVIDTLFRKNGDDYNDIHTSVSNGRVFVNYRGQGVSNWWSPFDANPNSTNPGYRLPVVMSATCGTGSYSSDGYPCETWMRAGTVGSPKGAVAFVSTSRIVSGGAHLRSVVNQNFYTGIFNLKMHNVGEALAHGKSYVYTTYGDEYEYEGWSVQGDPALDVWTAYPVEADVTHSPTVPSGPSSYLVTVEDGGNPVPSALVCAWAEGEVYETGTTDVNGNVTLSVNPVLADTMWVTVTGHNLHPYESYAVVTVDGPFLQYESASPDDSGGNNDGLVSPGETVALVVTLENSGPDNATNTMGTLRSNDTFVTLVDTTSSYGTILSGGTGDNLTDFTFEVGTDCPDGHELSLTLYATADDVRGAWTILVPDITVAAADLNVASVTVDDGGSGGDGDGVLEVGETAWLDIALDNDGALGVTGLSGLLSSSDPYIAITDGDGSFGDIAAGGSGSSAGNAFRVSVSPTTPPAHEFSFDLALTGEAATYTHTETVVFTETAGGLATQSPTGPDSYGYYAYDDTDTPSGNAPVYDWVEITSVGSIISDITNADAATTTLSLPFTFKYYGTNYTQISICSNGFLSLGVEDYRFGDNSAIPNAHGPDAMVAPFWDDLDPSDGGDIYEYYDSANHRYIVQFDANVHYGGGNPETFEVIFYDPAYTLTPTGDGVIVFQYQTVATVGSATIGIENPAQNDGIQYVYNGSHDQNGATVTEGRAIKFTTRGPQGSDVWLTVEDSEIDDSSGGDGDGVAEPAEVFDLILTVGNGGAGSASSVTGTLTTSDTDVTIEDGTAEFGTIPGGGSATNAASPFVVRVATSPSDETVELELQLSTGSRYDTYDIVTITLDLTGTGVEEPAVPLAFAVRQNYPNPFRGGTTLAFDLPRPAETTVEVYNVAGRRVTVLADRDFPAGRHSVRWDGRDADGHAVSAGIYFYRVASGANEAMRKMIVLK